MAACLALCASLGCQPGMDPGGLSEAQTAAILAESETPCYVGRAVGALAAAPDVGARSGGLFSSWGLAKEYGFTDAHGRRPDWGSFFPPKVREIVERDTPPSEEDMDLFVVRTRLHQVGDDPAVADEAARLRAYLDRNR